MGKTILSIDDSFRPPEEGPREVFLNPGAYAFGDDRTRIRTILGSCVAVTFWHSGLRLGAMCHYLLPTRGHAAAGTDLEATGGKYADDVIPLIADHFQALNLRPCTLEVKMFGGSSMFPGLSLGKSLSVGTKNIQMGLMILARSGFSILNYDLAGGANRMVVFDVPTGEVWVRQGPEAPVAPGWEGRGR